MKYIVVYTPEAGETEYFGTFDTVQEAWQWAKGDWEHNIDTAETNGVKVTTWIGFDNQCGIDEIGVWEVVKLNANI